MPDAFKVGDVVRTSGGKIGVVLRAGKKIVIETRPKGLVVAVYPDHVSHVTGGPEAPEEEPPPEPPDPAMVGDPVARRAIEALRFGIVPPEAVDELTIGFDALRKWTLNQLPNEQAPEVRVSEIVGAFGTGKTHTMAIIRQVALTEGYLTTRVEVDGTQVSLAKPDKLLRRLLSVPQGADFETAQPATETYTRAQSNGAGQPRVTKALGRDRTRDNYASIRQLRRLGELDRFATEIESVVSCGDDYTVTEVSQLLYEKTLIVFGTLKLRPLIGRRVDERPYDFVEALLGFAQVAALAGFKGVVVTIDEFEVEDEHSTAEGKRRIDELLDVLRQAVADPATIGCNEAPLAIFFAAVGVEGHLGDETIQEMVRLSGGEIFQLKPLSVAELRKLGERIHRMYRRAYDLKDLKFSKTEAEAVRREVDEHGMADSGLVRAFVKRYVAALDSTHGPP